ncbi:MAG TPA: cytochrome c biogenesis protein ResB [Candidatus Didemnitutus sp.]|nr:cytochrome c biogenesis protein ResB [Candidatus Didemnitutus sp.]
MKPLLREFRDFFVSMQLTVGLLFLSLILVFVATLDQVHLGIWAVQEKYFRSFFVMWHVPGTEVVIPIFPGGYFIGGFLLVNLIAAHIYRFKFTWRKIGIQLAHAGLILLLIGELVSGLMQRDSSMRIESGETKQYSESFRENELVVLNKTNPAYDEVVAIPEAVLADKGIIQHPKLPFRIQVKEYYPNSNLTMHDATSGGGTPTATAGIGTRVAMLPAPMTYKADERNLPGALIEVSGEQGVINSWIVSPQIGMPQTFSYDNRTWEIALRFKRYYKPFSLTLLKFSHDKYPGTEIPKNFSSRVRLKSDDGKEDREVLIFMNNPLRYGGLTFYQAGFEQGDRATILQVVRNPGWLIPYVACIMMGAGLVIQFGLTLAGFIRKRSKQIA